MSAHETIRMTEAEWAAEGERRFGPEAKNWRFVCPACGHVAAAREWIAARAGFGAVAISCIGRWTGAKREAFGDKANNAKPGPCNYAGRGLFRINPVIVTDKDGKEHQVFAFAEPEQKEAPA